MAQNGEKKGMLPQIVVAVVIALLVGGTSPWWFKEFFSQKEKTSPQVSQQPRPPSSKVSDMQAPKAYSGVIGASYEVECRDDKEKNIFSAIIQFPSENKARWRYTNSTSWQESLMAEFLSPHKILLSTDKNDPTHSTWNLEFSDDYRGVKGAFKFLQSIPPPTRWRNYSVVGSRME